LRDIFLRQRKELISIREANSRVKGAKVTFVGTVGGKPATRMSKNGNRYLVMEVSDESAKSKIMIFGSKLDGCEEINDGLPVEKNIVVVVGQKQDDDTVFADSITTQTNEIYTKLSELKKT
jgi:DNA polymerase III alpha subunit